MAVDPEKYSGNRHQNANEAVSVSARHVTYRDRYIKEAQVG